jgi:hypothetical protein
MKIKYISAQIKQFVLSSLFVVVAVVGVSLSNSFDQDYMAKVSEQEKMQKNIADLETDDSQADEEKTGVALAK